MIIINIFAMSLASLMLAGMLISTRSYDSVGWWAFRVLTCYGIVCFVYLAFDTNILGSISPIRYMFIRFGFLALVLSMLLSWYLISHNHKTSHNLDFNSRLKNVFKTGE